MNNRDNIKEDSLGLKPMMVILKDGKDPARLDNALKKLKRMIKNSRMMVEYQNHEYFRKPSAIRREKKLRAKLRNQAEVRDLKRNGF